MPLYGCSFHALGAASCFIQLFHLIHPSIKKYIMFKKIFMCLLLISVSSKLLAHAPEGNTLRGTVTDTRGHALQGAIVELPDLKQGTITDSNGHFLINGLPKGKFIVVVSLISYSKAAIPVAISGPATQNFTLTETAIESKEIVITGQSRATEINRSPIPVVAIGHKYLTENISS